MSEKTLKQCKQTTNKQREGELEKIRTAWLTSLPD